MENEKKTYEITVYSIQEDYANKKGDLIEENIPSYSEAMKIAKKEYATGFYEVVKIESSDKKFIDVLGLKMEKGGKMESGVTKTEIKGNGEDGYHFNVYYGGRDRAGFISASYKTEGEAEEGLEKYLETGKYDLYGSAEMEKGGQAGKYKLKSNQYMPQGMGKPASTYYYYEDAQGRIVDKSTLKPYRGHDMSRYAMKSKTEAEAYLGVINNEYASGGSVGYAWSNFWGYFSNDGALITGGGYISSMDCGGYMEEGGNAGVDKWVEIRNDYVEGETSDRYVDAWVTGADDEEGKSIAIVNKHGNVTYKDEDAKTDTYAQEMIQEAVAMAKKSEYGAGGKVYSQKRMSMSKRGRQIDGKVKAKHVGWRVAGDSDRTPTHAEQTAGKTKDGKSVFYEDRENRSDKSRSAKK